MKTLFKDMETLLKVLALGSVLSSTSMAAYSYDSNYGNAFKAQSITLAPADKSCEDTLPPTPEKGYETYNSLPPTPEKGYETYNSLPPTPEKGYVTYNSLPPTPEKGYVTYNSLPPTPEKGYVTYNSLPPTPEKGYETYNSLPPTPDYSVKTRLDFTAMMNNGQHVRCN